MELSKASQKIVETYQQIKDALPGQSSQTKSFREASLESFITQGGIPTRKHENWKYTSLKALNDYEFTWPSTAQSTIEAIQIPKIEGLKAIELIFIDGFFAQKLSGNLNALPKGLTIELLHATNTALGQSVKQSEHPLAALNGIFLQDGLSITVEKNQEIETPLHIIHIATKALAASTPRVLIDIKQNAKAQVIEHHVASTNEVYWHNAVTEANIEQGGNFIHYQLQSAGEKAHNIYNISVKQHSDSTYTSNNLSFGAGLTRCDHHIFLQQKGANCELNGLYLAKPHQHIDNHTHIEHISPHTNATEHYKGILASKARTVFNGKITVHPDAQKTNAIMNNHNLLLSHDAEADTKPELEIYADDVKCAHGATVGQLDKDSLFYLKARGIDETQAKQLLTHAFANEVISRVGEPAIQLWAEQQLNRWLTEAQA